MAQVDQDAVRGLHLLGILGVPTTVWVLLKAELLVGTLQVPV